MLFQIVVVALIVIAIAVYLIAHRKKISMLQEISGLLASLRDALKKPGSSS